jgi:hypothetical protein
MAIYSLSTTSTNTLGGQAAFDIKASSSNSFRLMELALNAGGAINCTYGLGRPGNDGSVAQSSPLAVLAENPNDPTGQSTTAVAWSTAPTVPSSFLRRGYYGAATGLGILWTFPRGLIASPSHGLVVWNITSNATLGIWIVVDE